MSFSTSIHVGDRGSARPAGGRRRTAAFSYTRVAKADRERSARKEETASSPADTHAHSGDGRNSHSSGSDVERTEYTFVSDVPGECLCDLCGELMEEPLRTQCCSKTYCQPCMEPPSPTPGRESSGTARNGVVGVECPACKLPAVELKPNEELKRRVEALHVKCVYASVGCVWEGEITWLKEHSERNGGCVYAPVTCSMCSMEIRRKDAQHHSESACKMRVVKCQFCEMEDTFETITGQHSQECPNTPLVCPLECGETVPRSKLADHLENECRSKGLPCPFKPVGCAASPIPSTEMKAHIVECSALHLSSMFQKFTAEIEGLRNQVQDLRADNQALREEVRTATTAMAEAEGVVDALSRRSDTVNKALLSELEYFYSTKQPAEMLAVECIKTQLASSLIHLQTGGCPATLRMTSYSSHKASGQVWYSTPFYIHEGYKLRLAVHLNGVGAGRGSHVSVYLHQMPGEFDNSLTWPYLLRDHVVVSLLKQTEYQRARTDSTVTRTTPRFFTRRPAPQLQQCDFVQTLPANVSPIRQKRKLTEEQRTPPKDNETILVAVEAQPMVVKSYLRRVKAKNTVLTGQFISKTELFCTQTRVADVVYRDSLVFQCALCSSNLTETCPGTP